MIEIALAAIGLFVALCLFVVSLWLLPFVLLIGAIAFGLTALGMHGVIAVMVASAIGWHIWMIAIELRHRWSPSPPSSPPPTAPTRGRFA
jgi:hypothetical protein